MQDNTLFNAQAIAKYLRDNPAFFDEHADVFAELSVPHPHEGRVISLGERQILTLRERLHATQSKLALLTHHAKDSERILAGVQEWCLELLAEDNARQLPERVTAGLARIFDIPYVALRLWNCEAEPDAAWCQPVSEDIELFADSLTQPYCGTETGFEAVSWLDAEPASLAMIPLRTAKGNTIGLLVLASDDATRFASGISVDFLRHIGALGGAALSRLPASGG